MKRTQLFGATVALALLAGTGHEVRATRSNSTIVVEWNQIVQDTIPGRGRPHGRRASTRWCTSRCSTRSTRSSVTSSRIASGCGTARRGSPEAAAAQAAHDVLVALNPPSAGRL